MKIRALYLLFGMTCLVSCKEYLDVKPDKKLVVPVTLQDMQAILNNVNLLNVNYPSIGETAADDYYLTYEDWAALRIGEDQSTYIWGDMAPRLAQWNAPYKCIFTANLVLETIEKKGVDNKAGRIGWDHAKGTALFFRGFNFFQLAQLFAKPYDEEDPEKGWGIPLRLTSNIHDKTVRASVNETYDRILQDLTEAAELLPIETAFKTRPNKAAAFGVLARAYLVMGKHELAGAYADSCLQLQNYLIDYNTLDPEADFPLARFNEEVLFHAVAYSPTISPSICKVDTLLYRSYAEDDLRRVIFFQENQDGSAAFKGSYDGENYGTIFNGITSAEMYLVMAESLARKNDVNNAMRYLNNLLKKRYEKDAFSPISASDANEALEIILSHRRKELIFRGLRWSDLRRLNSEDRFKKTLKRKLGEQTYELPPNDPRYVFLIPDEIIDMSGIPQNER
ncbi:SusD-like starch-binding protein associating with outer membrane [Anseongella ginsenosidimutans]|uniref:SusD-like starch-binding protein associating with outer membrane n=1 Tax=Anseongella ginsenosidimutans TaxID=496056 RepID=A0A4R3KV78_9SPHI|nr:RagB/SusD family nutrient uptake outer membrane protein [Anseongella ginsenosidimutans]QEC51502.1 RagB/SusD family nutrient uptake outer membrane protein [Anseongella ginsenosidimutans]TCS88814.1 SusD-like starch-binding protein associating with outer membrane [Anseongella ginsenosidimutans]